MPQHRLFGSMISYRTIENKAPGNYKHYSTIAVMFNSFVIAGDGCSIVTF
jgi:hypothetical protein